MVVSFVSCSGGGRRSRLWWRGLRVLLTLTAAVALQLHEWYSCVCVGGWVGVCMHASTYCVVSAVCAEMFFLPIVVSSQARPLPHT